MYQYYIMGLVMLLPPIPLITLTIQKTHGTSYNFAIWG